MKHLTSLEVRIKKKSLVVISRFQIFNGVLLRQMLVSSEVSKDIDMCCVITKTVLQSDSKKLDLGTANHSEIQISPEFDFADCGKPTI